MKWLVSLPLFFALTTFCYASDYSPSVEVALRLSAHKENIPYKVLRALCFVESSHNPKAINIDDGHGTSYGLCQIKYKTAKWLGYKGTRFDLFNPAINTKWAAKYLAYQLKRYNGNMQRALAAYNAGHSKYEGYNTKYTDKVFALID